MGSPCDGLGLHCLLDRADEVHEAGPLNQAAIDLSGQFPDAAPSRSPGRPRRPHEGRFPQRFGGLGHQRRLLQRRSGPAERGGKLLRFDPLLRRPPLPVRPRSIAVVPGQFRVGDLAAGCRRQPNLVQGRRRLAVVEIGLGMLGQQAGQAPWPRDPAGGIPTPLWD